MEKKSAYIMCYINVMRHHCACVRVELDSVTKFFEDAYRRSDGQEVQNRTKNLFVSEKILLRNIKPCVHDDRF